MVSFGSSIFSPEMTGSTVNWNSTTEIFEFWDIGSAILVQEIVAVAGA